MSEWLSHTGHRVPCSVSRFEIPAKAGVQPGFRLAALSGNDVVFLPRQSGICHSGGRRNLEFRFYICPSFQGGRRVSCGRGSSLVCTTPPVVPLAKGDKCGRVGQTERQFRRKPESRRPLPGLLNVAATPDWIPARATLGRNDGVAGVRSLATTCTKSARSCCPRHPTPATNHRKVGTSPPDDPRLPSSQAPA